MNSPIIHHVSVINRDVEKSFHFYNNILGLDLLLKTVNQEDLEMYHLFFSDTKGRPGTEFTIFQMNSGMKKTFGTNSIERTVFAVPTVESLYFWEKRLTKYELFNCEIENYNGSKILRFEDHDGVQLGLVPLKDFTNEFFGRETTDISSDHAIVGIDSVHLRVRYPIATANIMNHLFNLSITKTIQHGELPTIVLSKENNLLNQEIHIIEDKKNPLEVLGIGGAHHLALSVKDNAELTKVEEKVLERNFINSGIKNREFFYSLYFRDPNSLLIETATEESSYSKVNYSSHQFDDIPLYLPTFLESKRTRIENGLVN